MDALTGSVAWVLPLVGLLAVVAVAVVGSDRLVDRQAVRMLALHSTMLALTLVATASVVSISWITHHTVFSFAMHQGGHHRSMPAVAGATATIWCAVVATRLGRTLATHRRLRREVRRIARSNDADPLRWGRTEVDGVVWFSASADVFAYTLPGPAAPVVVSRGLVELLDQDGLEIVLAHERAHSQFRHDRLRLLGSMLSAVGRWFDPVVNRMSYSIERWADEQAAVWTGATRERIAHTIGKVALAGEDRTQPTAALGFGSDETSRRARALLQPPRATSRTGSIMVFVASVVVLAPTLALQAHHLAALFSRFCG